MRASRFSRERLRARTDEANVQCNVGSMRRAAGRAGLHFGIALMVLQIAAAQQPSPLEAGILEALNQLRAEPAGYVAVLRQRRPYYQGKLLKIPGKPDLLTQEGVHPLDEAIAALQSM